MISERNYRVASAVFMEIDRIRRRYHKGGSIELELEKIKAIQIPRILSFVNDSRPIEFILPAFPAKSPNSRKVLGRLPDMAEILSLSFLNDFCDEIKKMYEPGAKLKICSDGRVFSDLIRVEDGDVTAYQSSIRRIIGDFRMANLSVCNLEDFEKVREVSSNFNEMRDFLVTGYVEPIEGLKRKILASEEGGQLYRAITRFMYEDGLTPDYSGSNATLQKDSKVRALNVIHRSWAWSEFLATQFPHSIRLSIHPQPASSSKIGIHMMQTYDSWLTPWHGVAVDTGRHFVLMKRSDIERLGGRIVMSNGMPSHYEIDQGSSDSGEMLSFVNRHASNPLN